MSKQNLILLGCVLGFGGVAIIIQNQIGSDTVIESSNISKKQAEDKPVIQNESSNQENDVLEYAWAEVKLMDGTSKEGLVWVNERHVVNEGKRYPIRLFVGHQGETPQEKEYILFDSNTDFVLIQLIPTEAQKAYLRGIYSYEKNLKIIMPPLSPQNCYVGKGVDIPLEKVRELKIFMKISDEKLKIIQTSYKVPKIGTCSKVETNFGVTQNQDYAAYFNIQDQNINPVKTTIENCYKIIRGEWDVGYHNYTGPSDAEYEKMKIEAIPEFKEIYPSFKKAYQLGMLTQQDDVNFSDEQQKELDAEIKKVTDWIEPWLKKWNFTEYPQEYLYHPQIRKLIYLNTEGVL